MRDTNVLSRVQPPVANEGLDARLNWLLAENPRETTQHNLFRNDLEEEEVLLMHHPVTTERAFSLFGLLLGTLPPATIFIKLFSGASGVQDWALLLAMNAICGLTGCYLGSKMSRMVSTAERHCWTLMIIEALSIGFLWALCAGGAGGFLFYGIGAVFGAVCAVPVGAVGFGLFVPLHRLLARGGMIDARHFWPLACGVVMVITALILGM